MSFELLFCWLGEFVNLTAVEDVVDVQALVLQIPDFHAAPPVFLSVTLW